MTTLLTLAGIMTVHCGVGGSSGHPQGSVTPEQLATEGFSVPVSGALHFSHEASDELAKFCERIRPDRDNNRDEEYSQEELAEFDALAHKGTNELLRFIRLYPQTYSALTAKLLVAQGAQGIARPMNRTAVRMLNEIISGYPHSWQACVAPFVKSRLLFDQGQAIPMSDRLVAAREAVRSLVDGVEIRIPLEDPEVQCFFELSDRLMLENPIRASALSVIASCEFNLGRESPRKDGANPFEKAKTEYARILREYPESRAAENARGALTTIKGLENYGRDPSSRQDECSTCDKRVVNTGRVSYVQGFQTFSFLHVFRFCARAPWAHTILRR